MAKTSSLTPVLAVRLRAEESAERALAESCAEVQQASDMHQTLAAMLRQTLAESPGEAGDLLHPVALQAREQQIRNLRQACVQAREVLSEKENTRTVRQRMYLEVSRDREAIDTLLKQRARQQQEEQAKHEARLSQDLFLARLLRGSVEAEDLPG